MNDGGYPSDVSDEEWAFVAAYLRLMSEEAPQREHALAVYQQTQRWMKAEVFETMVHDLRELLRLCEGRSAAPSAMIVDSRTLQGTPESAGHAGYDGAKKKKGSKVHPPRGHPQ